MFLNWDLDDFVFSSKVDLEFWGQELQRQSALLITPYLWGMSSHDLSLPLLTLII